MPATAAAEQMFSAELAAVTRGQGAAQGRADEDYSAVIRLMERLAAI